jgi:hypothetical protein
MNQCKITEGFKTFEKMLFKYVMVLALALKMTFGSLTYYICL